MEEQYNKIVKKVGQFSKGYLYADSAQAVNAEFMNVKDCLWAGFVEAANAVSQNISDISCKQGSVQMGTYLNLAKHILTKQSPAVASVNNLGFPDLNDGPETFPDCVSLLISQKGQYDEGNTYLRILLKAYSLFVAEAKTTIAADAVRGGRNIHAK